MIYFFYILLAITSQGFFLLFFPGWIPQHILLIPIFIGYLGLCWGIFNLSHDPIVKWKSIKKTVYSILVGTITLLLSTVLIMITELFYDFSSTTFSILLLIGIILLILTGPLFAIGFFFFREDLKEHYFQKYLSKFPTVYISIAFLVQAVGEIFLLIGALFTETLGLIFFILGLVTVVISLIGLGVGFYPLFMSFRTYPKILELIEESLAKKQQIQSSKKSKKAS